MGNLCLVDIAHLFTVFNYDFQLTVLQQHGGHGVTAQPRAAMVHAIGPEVACSHPMFPEEITVPRV